MPITYSIDNSLGVIFEVWRGHITVESLGEYWKAYLANPDVMKCRRTLADIRESEIAFTGAEISNAITSIVVPRLGGKTWRTAILVAAPVQFGISRQYQAFAELYSEDSIFYNYDSALDWLTKSDSSNRDTVPIV